MKKNIEHNNIPSMPEFPYCFVCGQSNPRGLQMKFSIKDKRAEASFVSDQTHRGYKDSVHGGIISAILDEVVIWASYASTGSFGVTAELNVRFLKPVPIKKEFIIIGEMIENKGKILTGKGVMKDSSGNVYAQAKAKIVPLSKE